MSIIEEALRRVQDPTGRGTGTPPPAAAPQPPTAKTHQQVQAPPPLRAPEPPASAHSWQPSASASAPVSGSQSGPLFAVVGAVLILTAVLVTGGAFWMGRAMNKPGSTAGQPAAVAPKPEVEQEAAPDQPEARIIRSPRPRRAAKAPGDASTSLVLSGVVEGLGEPYAVINGLIVAAGERVGNATLERIGNGSVLLRRDDGREITLSVPR